MEISQEQADRIERKLDDLLAYFHVGEAPQRGRAEIKNFVTEALLHREEKRRKS